MISFHPFVWIKKILLLSCCYLVACNFLCTVDAFCPLPQSSKSSTRTTTSSSSFTTTTLYEYKFGDITRGILGKARHDITQVTGKKEYEFGDLTKWLDQRAKTRVQNFTNKTSHGGNDGSSQQYQFGDITREIIRRLSEREYTQEDIFLVVKLIAFAGLNFTPIARILPGKVLIEILEVSIAQTVGEKVISSITTELDGRMKEMVTGDKHYQFGDITKKTLTGNKDYQFGDFTKAAISRMFDDKNNNNNNNNNAPNNDNDGKNAVHHQAPSSLDQKTLDTLEEWDQKFLTSTKSDAKLILGDEEIQKWDEKFRTAAAAAATAANDTSGKDNKER